MKFILALATVSMLSCATTFASPYTLTSPDGHLKATITAEGNTLNYSLSRDKVELVAPSAIGLQLHGVSNDFKVKKKTLKYIDETISTLTYKKRNVRNNCNELTLMFKNYGVVFRAYNEGFAYRYVAPKATKNVTKNTTKNVSQNTTNGAAQMIIDEEIASFCFSDTTKAWISYTEMKRIKKEDMKANIEKQFHTSFEYTYVHTDVKDAEKDHLAFLPLLVDAPGDMKICITETALFNYPGMYIVNPDGGNSFKGVFAPYPASVELGGHNMLQMRVTEREDYIAKMQPGDVFPWRILAVSQKDAQLVENDLAFILAPGQAADIDFSFVKPGKVAWDWWNNWNLYNVPFEAGINNDTYKYYIDFASKNGIEYVILDEGWSTKYKGDLLSVIPEIDLPMLLDYAAERNVGLILWAGYYAFEKDMEKVCAHYSKMGVKGFKVDFMDRDDQQMVDFHRRAAEMTARYGLMIDFHGTYKPAGLHRTYPNVINYEGVHGMEQMKWRSPETDQVKYDVTIPFIRLVAGPADYTQGAMRNASKENYRPCNTEPMSQGTRCRQLAEYVVFDAPLTMLCDSPSNYMMEPECTKMIASVPTVWDDVIGLDGKVGEYVCEARRSGEDWWVGALTDWNAREMNVDLSFLPEGNWKMTLFCDGPNAKKAARDYSVSESVVTAGSTVDVTMAPGGGFIMKFVRAE